MTYHLKVDGLLNKYNNPKAFNQKFEQISKSYLGKKIVVTAEGDLAQASLVHYLRERAKSLLNQPSQASKELIELSLLRLVEFGAEREWINKRNLAQIKLTAIQAGLIDPKALTRADKRARGIKKSSIHQLIDLLYSEVGPRRIYTAHNREAGLRILQNFCKQNAQQLAQLPKNLHEALGVKQILAQNTPAAPLPPLQAAAVVIKKEEPFPNHAAQVVAAPKANPISSYVVQDTPPANLEELLVELKANRLKLNPADDSVEAYFYALMGDERNDNDLLDTWVEQTILCRVFQGCDTQEDPYLIKLFGSLNKTIGSENAFALLARCYQLVNYAKEEYSTVSLTGHRLQNMELLLKDQLQKLIDNKPHFLSLNLEKLKMNKKLVRRSFKEELVQRQVRIKQWGLVSQFVRRSLITFQVLFAGYKLYQSLVPDIDKSSTNLMQEPATSTPVGLKPQPYNTTHQIRPIPVDTSTVVLKVERTDISPRHTLPQNQGGFSFAAYLAWAEANKHDQAPLAVNPSSQTLPAERSSFFSSNILGGVALISTVVVGIFYSFYKMATESSSIPSGGGWSGNHIVLVSLPSTTAISYYAGGLSTIGNSQIIPQNQSNRSTEDEEWQIVLPSSSSEVVISSSSTALQADRPSDDDGDPQTVNPTDTGSITTGTSSLTTSVLSSKTAERFELDRSAAPGLSATERTRFDKLLDEDQQNLDALVTYIHHLQDGHTVPLDYISLKLEQAHIAWCRRAKQDTTKIEEQIILLLYTITHKTRESISQNMKLNPTSKEYNALRSNWLKSIPQSLKAIIVEVEKNDKIYNGSKNQPPDFWAHFVLDSQELLGEIRKEIKTIVVASQDIKRDVDTHPQDDQKQLSAAMLKLHLQCLLLFLDGYSQRIQEIRNRPEIKQRFGNLDWFNRC